MVILGSTVAFALAATGPFSTGPSPTFRADSYQLRVQTSGSFVVHQLLGPERFTSLASDPKVPDVAVRGGTLFTAPTRTTTGSRVVNRYATWPDTTVNGPDDIGLRLAQYVVAEARAGKLTLASDVLGGRAVWRAEVDLAANACTDVPEGVATVWLTKTTLLPKRVRIERDSKVQVFGYKFVGFNQDFADTALTVPPMGTRFAKVGNGFLRRSPVAAANPLPFHPRLPSVLPSGFTLVTSGWARRGAATGPAGRNKRDPNLFAAVYQRGWERIEITQRVATNGTWKRDPFARACREMQAGRAVIGAIRVRYGIGPEIPSHIWYRDGPFLITVSGPFGKRDLQAIATSLKPIN